VITEPTEMYEELRRLVVWMDDDLDGEVAERYNEQPLAQDWARVAKVGEEAGEAIDALIGVTGQNPRKGEYGSQDDLLNELADVALTGLYAIQHFVKNGDETLDTLMRRARHHRERRDAQIAASAQPAVLPDGRHTMRCVCDGRGIVPGPIGGRAKKCPGPDRNTDHAQV
jgi:NTP pyrophosphatase (non-canonical NTP hydrolase)